MSDDGDARMCRCFTPWSLCLKLLQLDVEHCLAWLSRYGEFSDRLDQFWKFRPATRCHVRIDALPSDQSLEKLRLSLWRVWMVLFFNGWQLSDIFPETGPVLRTPANHSSCGAAVHAEAGNF